MLDMDRPKAATYLTGYAIECMMKSWLIIVTQRNRREELVDTFRGSRAHNLIWLRENLVRQGISLTPAINKALVFLSSWSTDLRYEPGVGDRDDAERFVKETEQVLEWINERI